MSKLDGIKPGDRVRVTFEARVLEGDEYSSDTLGVALDGSHAGECVLFPARQRNASTFQIERIDPPLKVGDRVRFLSNEMSTTGVILAFDPHPVIRFEPPSGRQYYDSVKASDLVRA